MAVKKYKQFYGNLSGLISKIHSNLDLAENTRLALFMIMLHHQGFKSYWTMPNQYFVKDLGSYLCKLI